MNTKSDCTPCGVIKVGRHLPREEYNEKILRDYSENFSTKDIEKLMEIKKNSIIKEIDSAMKFLEKQGYCTAYMPHVDDVVTGENYIGEKVLQKEKMDILRMALGDSDFLEARGLAIDVAIEVFKRNKLKQIK